MNEQAEERRVSREEDATMRETARAGHGRGSAHDDRKQATTERRTCACLLAAAESSYPSPPLCDLTPRLISLSNLVWIPYRYLSRLYLYLQTPTTPALLPTRPIPTDLHPSQSCPPSALGRKTPCIPS